MGDFIAVMIAKCGKHEHIQHINILKSGVQQLRYTTCAGGKADGIFSAVLTSS